ncbi:hypothetical protein PANA5342_0799 [Pantoea ananatis LMG 5342]|nr:hypothetical protein PANA5342_0799 [Pantoea ananatis LMG 5342]
MKIFISFYVKGKIKFFDDTRKYVNARLNNLENKK